MFPLPRRTHQGPKHGFRCAVFAFTSTRTCPSAASLQGERACGHAGGQAAHPATPSRCQPRCGAGKLDDWLQGGVRYWFRLIRTSISRRGRRIAFPRKARLALFAAQPSEHSTRLVLRTPACPAEARPSPCRTAPPTSRPRGPTWRSACPKSLRHGADAEPGPCISGGPT